MRELYKDVQIGEHFYRIGKMSARNGSWLAMQVMSYMLPSAVQAVAASVDGQLPSVQSSRQMSETEFHNIQDHCLAVCTRLRIEPTGAQVYFPLWHDSGKWNFDDLEDDVVAIMTLTVQALIFNLKPFFAQGAMQQITAAMMDTQKTPTIISTDTASGPSSPDSGGNMKRGTARIT